MLQDIRDNSQGIVAKFIIGLIILTFALFGIDSLVGGGGPAKAATVNGEDISVFELEQAVNNQKRQLINRFGDQLNPGLLNDDRLRGPALEQLVTRKVLLQAADESAMGISPEAIDQTILARPEFQEEGKFSPERYQSLLRSNGYSTAYFKQLLRDDLLLNQLNTAVAGSDFITTPALEKIAVSIGEQRSFRYLTIPQSTTRDQVKLTEQQQQDYYQQNLASFQTDNSVKLDYIEVRQSDFFKPVDPEQLQAAYEEEVASFTAQTERRASHILIEINDDRSEQQALQEVEALAKKIAEGKTFANVATASSEDPSSAESGGDLGFSSGDVFPPEFEEALAGLSVGQVSAPVKTDAGYHLIQATEVNEKQAPGFDELAPQITQRLQNSSSEAAFVAAVEELKDLVFNSEGLKAVAEELELPLADSGVISRATATGSLANLQVLDAAFSDEVLVERSNSEVIELAADHYIVVSVTEHQPPAPKSFETVKDTIIAQLTQQQATELSKQLAEQVIVQLEQGESMESLAEQGGYTWQVQQNLQRSDSQVDRQILLPVFELAKPDASAPLRDTLTLNNGDVVVVQLEKVSPGSWQQFDAPEQRAIRSELSRNAAQQNSGALVRTLRDQAEINIL